MIKKNYRKLPLRSRNFWECDINDCSHKASYYYRGLEFDSNDRRKGTSYTLESWRHTANLKQRFICKKHYLELKND